MHVTDLPLGTVCLVKQGHDGRRGVAQTRGNRGKDRGGLIEHRLPIASLVVEILLADVRSPPFAVCIVGRANLERAMSRGIV
jgi:hypothetical protein